MSDKPAMFVDCEDNPYDMRPVIGAIMDAENWILSRIPKKQKLIIVMAEAHNAQTHSILQEAVAHAHKVQAGKDPSRPFAFGYESPHNMDISDDSLIAEGFSVQCPEATNELLYYVRQHKIDFRFNDAAMHGRHFKGRYDLCLNVRDKITRKHVKRWADTDKDIIPAHEAMGMAIRNSIMVENAMRHLKESKARIYMQQCGVTHMFGNMVALYQDSLVAMFKDRGYAVLPVAPDTFDLNPAHMRAIPREIMQESILVSQMAKGEEPMDYNEVRAQVIAATGPSFFA